MFVKTNSIIGGPVRDSLVQLYIAGNNTASINDYKLAGQRYTLDNGITVFYVVPNTKMFFKVTKPGFATRILPPINSDEWINVSESNPYVITLTPENTNVVDGLLVYIPPSPLKKDKTEFYGWVENQRNDGGHDYYWATNYNTSKKRMVSTPLLLKPIEEWGMFDATRITTSMIIQPFLQETHYYKINSSRDFEQNMPFELCIYESSDYTEVICNSMTWETTNVTDITAPIKALPSTNRKVIITILIILAAIISGAVLNTMSGGASGLGASVLMIGLIHLAANLVDADLHHHL